MADIGGDLLPVLEQIERDKGIKKEDLLSMIETALVSAYKKHNRDIENVESRIDPETGIITLFVIKEVVKSVSNDGVQISLKNAKVLDKNVKIGDNLRIETDISNFGRIAAQTAKQVIIQKIRETEKEHLYNEFKEKEGDVINGQVTRFINNTAILDLGKLEAIIPLKEQIPEEDYRPGAYLKLYVFRVELTPKGPKVVLSRTHPELLRRLFEIEVPEVYDGTITLKSIARDPGRRSKVAVSSNNPRVDAVGACVGVKGSRIRAVIDELNGEKIDLVPFSLDTKQYIINSLKPAQIKDVFINLEERNAEVVVMDDQLSIAIGGKGSNVRLAARLTGWHLDITTETQRREDKEKQVADSINELEEIEGIGKRMASMLVAGGYSTIDKLKAATIEDLLGLQGVGKKTAEKIVDTVKKI